MVGETEGGGEIGVFFFPAHALERSVIDSQPVIHGALEATIRWKIGDLLDCPPFGIVVHSTHPPPQSPSAA